MPAPPPRRDASAATPFAPRATPAGSANLRSELTAQLSALHRRARQLCRDASRADDLVQDTVRRALEFEHTYAPGTNARAWLQRVMMSVFISGLRRSTRERRALTRFGHDPSACLREAPAPVLGNLTPALRRAVGSLPLEFSSVLWLVDVEERTYSDAAASLDIPLGTVMSRLWRGRRRLARALQRADGQARDLRTTCCAPRADSAPSTLEAA